MSSPSSPHWDSLDEPRVLGQQNLDLVETRAVKRRRENLEAAGADNWGQEPVQTLPVSAPVRKKYGDLALRARLIVQSLVSDCFINQLGAIEDCQLLAELVIPLHYCIRMKGETNECTHRGSDAGQGGNTYKQKRRSLAQRLAV